MLKIKNQRKRIITTSIALLLMASIAVLSIPNTNALSPAPGKMSIPTYAFIHVAPNPIGIGQTATVNFFLNRPPPTADTLYGDRWHNMTVLVTKPDGTTQTLGPFSSDAVGGAYTTYTPDQLGNYTFVFHYGGQVLAGENPGQNNFAPEAIGNLYEASTSETATLIVQETPIGYSPVAPLPTEYWVRPIFAMNTEWYQISGNWLGLGRGGGNFAPTGRYSEDSNFNPYTTGPNTAHILWTKPYAPGGLIGGEFGNSQENSNFKSTSQYEPNWSPIIMNGILYYTHYPGAYTNPAGFVAVDLQTGKTLWTKDYNEVLICGQLMNFVSPNQYGATPYLWATSTTNNTLSMFDATTGNWILNVDGGPTYFWGIIPSKDETGSFLTYYIDYADLTIKCWNSTKAIMQYGITTGTNLNSWEWRPPQGVSINWSLGIEWAAPIPTEINGIAMNSLLSPSRVSDNVVLLYAIPTFSSNEYYSWNPGYTYQAGLDAETGELLWGPINSTRTAWTKISGDLYVGTGPAGDGVWVEYISETASWDAYSLTTGKHVWGPVSGGHNSQSFNSIHSDIAYGTLYTADYGGYVNAFNITTGKLLWTWNTGSSGLDTPYGNYPVLHIDAIADGKVYVMGGHTYSPPLYHYAKLYCLNATTGVQIWNINDYTTANGPEAAIADGILLEPNAYDNQIYAFGKGPTKLTVNVPAVGVTTSAPITISGAIIDISPGADQLAVAKNFPNGLPCVSDASMTGFMEAVYQQQTMPTNLTGVPVIINVVDSNGNYRTIGTTTSNAYGTYSLTWTPDISGDYTVITTFAGTDSYYSSEASAAFHASEQAATLTTQPTQTPSAADLYFIPAIVGVIIAIIVVGAVLAMLVSKKP
jgi:hypothetical protein